DEVKLAIWIGDGAPRVVAHPQGPGLVDVVPRPSGLGVAAGGDFGPGLAPNKLWARKSMPWSIWFMTNDSMPFAPAVRGTSVTHARGSWVSSRSACAGAVGTVTAFCGLGRISPTARIETSISPGRVSAKWRRLSRSGTLWNRRESELPPPEPLICADAET